jgi:hypothetical protein
LGSAVPICVVRNRPSVLIDFVARLLGAECAVEEEVLREPVEAVVGTVYAWVWCCTTVIAPPGELFVEPTAALLDHPVAGGAVVREYETVPAERTEENPHGLYTLTPDRIRRLPEEEIAKREREARAARSRGFRDLYEALDLRVVAHKDRSLEVTWSGGEDTLRCPNLRGRGPAQTKATPRVVFRASIGPKAGSEIEVSL